MIFVWLPDSVGWILRGAIRNELALGGGAVTRKKAAQDFLAWIPNPLEA